MHLFAFTVEIYYDARPYGRQICGKKRFSTLTSTFAPLGQQSCDPYAPAALYPQGNSLVPISVKGWVGPRANERGQKEWVAWRFPRTFLNMLISFLYMFQTTMCPSSGETTVSMRHLVLVILCRWLSGKQGGTNTGIHGQQNIIFQESYWESNPKPPVLWRSASNKLATARLKLSGGLKWFPAAQSINTKRCPPSIIM